MFFHSVLKKLRVFYMLWSFFVIWRRVRIQKKALAWNFETLQDYSSWLLETNGWVRSGLFLKLYVSGGNAFFKDVYLLEKHFKSKNPWLTFLLSIIHFFFLNIYLFFVLFTEGVLHNRLAVSKHIYDFYQKYHDYFIFSSLIIFKSVSITIYNIFALVFFYLFFWPKLTYNNIIAHYRAIKGAKQSLRMTKVLFENHKELLETVILDYEEIDDFEELLDEALLHYESSYYSHISLNTREYLLELADEGDRRAAYELTRLRKMDLNPNYVAFHLSHLFGFTIHQISYFFFLLPAEKIINILLLVFSLVKWPFDHFKYVLNAAFLPIVLTNFLFFFFRFCWASIWTMPIAYGYLWSMRYLRKIGWLKLHGHCWPWWVGYWRILVIVRYTFRIPSYFYRQPPDEEALDALFRLSYHDRIIAQAYYLDHIPFYGLMLCFIWFQTCMFWFPPTWSHKAVYIGFLKIF